MKFCQDCKNPIPEDTGNIRYKRFCPECVRKHKRAGQLRRREELRAMKEMESFKAPKMSIAEVQRLAREAGMSYGNYVAKMRG